MVDYGVLLGALGLISGMASAAYSRGQVVAARAQLKDAREQAVEALRAADLVAENAREQADAALRAAELLAENARQQAVEALRAAELVAETARKQADAALRVAELLAISDISARVRAMRASNFASNPSLPDELQAAIKRAGGAAEYSVLLDSMEAAQEIYFLRKRGAVTRDQWRGWMHDIPLVVANPVFEEVFRRAAKQDVLAAEFVAAFEPVLRGEDIVDPADELSGSG
jgi:multidrug efflux pump subunit AcrA (membrane-fusion protein)